MMSNEEFQHAALCEAISQTVTAAMYAWPKRGLTDGGDVVSSITLGGILAALTAVTGHYIAGLPDEGQRDKCVEVATRAVREATKEHAEAGTGAVLKLDEDGEPLHLSDLEASAH